MSVTRQFFCAYILIVILIVKSQGAPQQLTIAKLDSRNLDLDKIVLIAEPSESKEKDAEQFNDENGAEMNDDNDRTSLENSLIDTLKEDIKKENHNTVRQSTVFLRADTMDTSEGDLDEQFEEALRNERELNQATSEEQKLLNLAGTCSDVDDKKDIAENKCSSDAHTLRCHNGTTVALFTSSGDQQFITCSGQTPVCHPTLKVCSSQRLVDRDITNAADNITVQCPNYNAYYPDLSTCRRFYYCNNGKPYQYSCADNEVYNPMTRACALQSGITPCRRFRCEGHNGRFTPYPGDPSVYSLCNNNLPIEMFHCPAGQALHDRSQQCETYCKTEGLVPDPTSCNHYYECTAKTGPSLVDRYKSVRRSCPPMMVFEPTQSFCVPQDEYKYGGACKKVMPASSVYVEPPQTTLRTYQTPTTTRQSLTTTYSTLSTDGAVYSTMPSTDAGLTTMQF